MPATGSAFERDGVQDEAHPSPRRPLLIEDSEPDSDVEAGERADGQAERENGLGSAPVAKASAPTAPTASKTPLFFEDSEPDSGDEAAKPEITPQDPQAQAQAQQVHSSGGVKRRRLSPPAATTASASKPHVFSPAPTAAGGVDVPALAPADMYVGEYFCSGWSLNKGKGYCSPGSRIVIERNKTPAEREAERAAKRANGRAGAGADAGQAVVSGPTVIRNGKVIKPGKQMTLGAMGIGAGKKGKTAGAVGSTGGGGGKKAATPADTVVRFRNERGFEVGRLPTADAAFIAPLLDGRVVALSGSVVDCPAILSTGCDILLCIRVHLLPDAFARAAHRDQGRALEEAHAGTFWNNQAETEEERAMRVRKVALGQLFGASCLCAPPVSYHPLICRPLLRVRPQTASRSARCGPMRFSAPTSRTAPSTLTRPRSATLPRRRGRPGRRDPQRDVHARARRPSGGSGETRVTRMKKTWRMAIAGTRRSC